MKYSLVSRDWIADCIEITHAGYTGVRYEVSFKGDFPKFFIVLFLTKMSFLFLGSLSAYL